MSKTRQNKKTLIIGALIIFIFSAVCQATSITTFLLKSSSAYSYKSLINILSVVRDIFELLIYSSEISLLLVFVRVGEKKYRNLAFIAAMLILFLDYGISFAIDFAAGSIDGYELWTALYLLLNILARALLFSVTLLFAGRIMRNGTVGAAVLPIPFFSSKNPTSKMLLSAALVRSAPYILFEIYANITGIIEYGFDMSASDVLSIVSAYAEIVIAGVIIYSCAYLLSIMLLHIHEKVRENEEL